MTATDDLIARIHDLQMRCFDYGWLTEGDWCSKAAAALREQRDEIVRLLAEREQAETDAKSSFDLSVECRARAVKAEAEIARLSGAWAAMNELQASEWRRAEKAESDRDAAIRDAERYWPFVEMVGMKRPPRGQDEVDAYEMVRERKRAAMKAKP